jgi:dipeptidyl aminopeptidase/acylaminoacyl peptidase
LTARSVAVPVPPRRGAAARGPALLALLALAALLALSVARGQATSALRAAAPLDADLAFVARDGRLAWLPAGATEARRHGGPETEHAFPAWSPDGRRIAALARSRGGARVVVLEPGGGPGGAPRVATWFDEPGAPAIYLDWSRDGRALLVLAGDAESGFTLRRVDASGDAVLARGAPLYWDQAPDGRLLVHVGGGAHAGVRLLTPDGEVLRELAAEGAFRSPAVSADGRWLAFAERGAGDVRRVVVERASGGTGAAGEGPPRLGDDPDRRALDHRGLAAFAWHPARPLLALTRPLNDAPHAFGPLGALDADDGLFEPWLDLPVLAFWWAPDGRRLAVLAGDAPAPERVARAADGARLVPVQRRAPGFRLGLLDPATGAVQRWTPVAPSAGFLRDRLPHADQYARSHRSWSPDGRLFALTTQDAEGRPTIAILEGDGRLRELVAGAMPAFPPPAR